MSLESILVCLHLLAREDGPNEGYGGCDADLVGD